jgi:UPF0716 protein FxsA
MRLALLLVFVAYPLLELALLIRAGQAWGFWPVLAAIVGTGLLGAAVLRRQGFKVAEQLSEDLNAGRAPVAPLADSGLIFAAGAFLMSPGLIGDALGLLLLIPPVRNLVRTTLAARLEGSSTVVVRHGTKTRWRHREPPKQEGPPVIEGEWERVDDDRENRS